MADIRQTLWSKLCCNTNIYSCTPVIWTCILVTQTYQDSLWHCCFSLYLIAITTPRGVSFGSVLQVQWLHLVMAFLEDLTCRMWEHLGNMSRTLYKPPVVTVPPNDLIQRPASKYYWLHFTFFINYNKDQVAMHKAYETTCKPTNLIPTVEDLK